MRVTSSVLDLCNLLIEHYFYLFEGHIDELAFLEQLVVALIRLGVVGAEQALRAFERRKAETNRSHMKQVRNHGEYRKGSSMQIS